MLLNIKNSFVSIRGKILSNLAWIFVFLAFGTGISLPLLTPLNQVPDEASHIARAAALGHFAIFGQRREFHGPDGYTYKYSGLMINSGLAQATHDETNFVPTIFTPPYPEITKNELEKTQKAKWSNRRVFVQCPNSLQYFPAMYIPGTIGIYLGKFLGFSPLYSLVFGRIMMLLSYITMGFFAIKTARFGRSILFALLLLPFCINLAASFNQDAQIIAACALACALLTTGLDKMRYYAAFILMLVMCSKPPYGLLLVVLLFPLSDPGLIKRIGLTVVAGIPALIWYALSRAIDLVPFLIVQFYLPGPLWSGSIKLMRHQSTTKNLHVLMSDPIRFISIPWHTVIQHWIGYLSQMIGLFGYNAIIMPIWIYVSWITILFLSFLGSISYHNKNGLKTNAIDKLVLCYFVILSVWILIIAIYISWAMTGAVSAVGMTGRYFLLFPPFLMLGMPKFGEFIDRKIPNLGGSAGIEFLCIFPAIVMAFFDAAYIPAFVAQSFYLH